MVVIGFTSFVLKKKGGNKVTLYRKIKVLVPLGVGFMYKNIQNNLGAPNVCITNISKKQQPYLPLKNCPGQSWKKSTISMKDHHFTQLMKKNRPRTSRQLASKWISSNGKIISSQAVRRRLFNIVTPINENHIESLIIITQVKVYGSSYRHKSGRRNTDRLSIKTDPHTTILSRYTVLH